MKRHDYRYIMDFVRYRVECDFLNTLPADLIPTLTGESLADVIQLHVQSLPSDAGDYFIFMRQTFDEFTVRPDRFHNVSIQFVVQALHDTDALKLILHLLENIPEQYEIEWSPPPERPGSDLIVSQIKPTGGPIPMGDVGAGRFQYSVNYTLIHGAIEWE